MGKMGQPATETKEEMCMWDGDQGCRMQNTKTEYVSCPSCGRTLFDLQDANACYFNFQKKDVEEWERDDVVCKGWTCCAKKAHVLLINIKGIGQLPTCHAYKDLVDHNLQLKLVKPKKSNLKKTTEGSIFFSLFIYFTANFYSYIYLMITSFA